MVKQFHPFARKNSLLQAGNRKRRIALYSHDTQGLGHMRRNLSIATSLIQADPNSDILMIAGAREAGAFNFPPGVDCITLPALGKNNQGQYQARSLNLSLKSIIKLRRKIIRATLKSFKPDVLIVDKVPLGVFGELLPSLRWLRANYNTHLVLGLREILDAPEVVYDEWHLSGYDDVAGTYYDDIWVYGDPHVYNPVREYNFSANVAAKLRYTGYLNRNQLVDPPEQEELDTIANLDLPPGRLALCMVGGGQDGYQLAEAFLQATLPPDTNGLVITGPFMSPEEQQALTQLAETCPRRTTLSFIAHPERLLAQADSVVSMGGYNTICEILSLKKRALIVPRVEPRREQLIRAERLHAMGLLDWLHPTDLNSQSISTWLATDPQPQRQAVPTVDLTGLSQIPHLLNEMLARSIKKNQSETIDSKFPALNLPKKETQYVRL